MFPRPLVLLAVLSLLYSTSAHVFIRQDDPSASATDTGTGDGSGDAGASAAASPEPSSDAAVASPSPTDSGASAPSASASNSAGDGTSALGGAGTGGALPQACASCLNTYSLVHLCNTQGSSESCSPICTNWTASTNCLDCLVANGQPNVDQAGLQQVVWNLEASCSDLELGVASVDITATPTATGPFTTPSTTPTPSASGNATTSTVPHSGITVYNTNLRTPTMTVPTSEAVNPSMTGAASRRRDSIWGKGMVVAAGVVGVGAVVL